jgi:uncharacterized protein (DUF362 family)
MELKKVALYTNLTYEENILYKLILSYLLTTNHISPGNTVILKPNWVKESHLFKPREWDYVITHPVVITATLRAVLELLNGSGRVIITDGPQTDSSFSRIMELMKPDRWKELGSKYGIPVEVLDLRDDEWCTQGDLLVSRKKLPGDPLGNTEVNLQGELSEFFQHTKSLRGYYGADYNIKETNQAHDGWNNVYRVSRTVIEADVFINLPKLKTHKKGGITCCLKNLVGINTYKNFLPHHNEGSCAEGGDQFPFPTVKSRIEGTLMAVIKQHILRNVYLARLFIPIKKIGKILFGSTEQVVRSGNWYGNDTIWRMMLDLNKILLYANPNGTMRPDEPVSRKRYIGIVDGIYAGEGNGPMAPDKSESGFLFMGTNPVAIDAACATLMGFDYRKIPSIARAFDVKNYKLADFFPDDIRVSLNNTEYSLAGIPEQSIITFKPHFGWRGHIERKGNE